MNVLATFFELDANRMVLNFVHGLIFFLMGFGILLKSKRWSDLTLAKSLPLLGMFGILNALGDWGLVFLPIQSQVFPPTVMGVLWVFDEVVLALSYTFLLAFGCRLLADTSPAYRWLPRVPAMLFAAWLGALLFALLSARIDPVQGPEGLRGFEIAYRYGFALTGSLVSAWALLLQRRELEELELDTALISLRWVGIALAAHGIAAGLLGPFHEAFLTGTSVPLRFITGLSGAVVALCTLVVLDAFDVEVHRRVEEARRLQAVSGERVRIARDLHDGIIQTLYALGLSLEGVLLSLDKSSEDVKKEIRAIMAALNRTIKDVRGYILELKTPSDLVSLDEQLRVLHKELSREARIPIRLRAESVAPGIIPAEAVGNILLAVREAVSNALRHARASEVEISLTRDDNGLYVRVRDDGIGFDPSHVPQPSGGLHQGLENMRRRAEATGGRLVVSSKAGEGTEVGLDIPFRQA